MLIGALSPSSMSQLQPFVVIVYSLQWHLLARCNVYRKMFIGGLNWDTTDGTLFYITAYYAVGPVVLKVPFVVLLESLRKYFSQFGKVEACTIMRDAAGRSRCFAFLTFEEPQSVNAVMVREHFLDGKIVRRRICSASVIPVSHVHVHAD